MSYISDWLNSDGSEEAYQEYRSAAAEDNARDRWEREHMYDEPDDDDLVLDLESDDDGV